MTDTIYHVRMGKAPHTDKGQYFSSLDKAKAFVEKKAARMYATISYPKFAERLEAPNIRSVSTDFIFDDEKDSQCLFGSNKVRMNIYKIELDRA